MPRNGSGVYSLVTTPFATAGQIAVATTVNANINDLGTEITGSLPRNGSAGMTAGLAMGGNKITGLAAGTTAGDAVRYEQAALLDVANVFTADQTVRSADAGAAEGPLVTLDRNSASPAVGDIIGGLKFGGRDSGAGTDTYARLLATILDPTAASEDGELSIGTVVAGTIADRCIVGQGVRIGSPAGGDKGVGTLNATNIYINNVSISPFGKQSIWLPAASLTARTTNGAGSSMAETTTNKIMRVTKDFDASTEEFAQAMIRMPKSWNEGTVTFIPVWSHPATATNFGVVWSFSAVAISNDDTLDSAFGTAVTSTDTGGTTDDLYEGPETSVCTIGGSPAEGDSVVVQISRAVANGSDTMAVDARLHGFLMLYTINAATDD